MADCVQLRAFSQTAADQRRRAFGLGEMAVVLENLHGQLAGGQQHESARALDAFWHPLDQRDEETEGFAGTCLGGGNHVAAFEGGRDRSGLDRGWGDEVGGGNLLLQGRRKVEFRKEFQFVLARARLGFPR